MDHYISITVNLGPIYFIFLGAQMGEIHYFMAMHWRGSKNLAFLRVSKKQLISFIVTYDLCDWWSHPTILAIWGFPVYWRYCYSIFYFFKVLRMSKCYTVEILILEMFGVKVPLLAILLSHTYIQVYSKWMWCLW